MAFRQPTFHAPQRVYTATQETEPQTSTSQTQQHNIAESQEWILFSPSAASTTDRGYTNSTTARTRTAGHSRIIDFGSLNTAARSYDYDEGSENAIDEEDGELDSLDSHLHEFRAEPSVYRESQGGEASGGILPTHDGLGSFRIDQPMGDDVQEHLYAFERYNPRRVKRRRESLEIGILEEGERAAEAERTRRIEMWRMEQSRLLVDEIKKETRRRKESMSSERRKPFEDKDEDAATLSHVEETPDEESDSFWSSITKRVIRDLMGIDDDLLAIIFGETLPEDDDLSTTLPASQSIIQTKINDKSSWEHRLLERVAQELGILVSQLSDHPGAFSTYLHSQQIPLPYAGLPVIPETRDHTLESSIQTSPQFHPTIQTQALAIPIPTTSLATPSPILDSDATPRASNPLNPTMTREEWEQDLDIKAVFRYLRSRLTSKFKSQTDADTPTYSIHDFTTSGSGTAHLATASTADTAARAARVRQHHPLVTRQSSSTAERRRSIERRTWRASVPGGASSGNVGLSGGVAVGVGIRRASSSCASERLSLNGRGVRSGSSRHYWDFGGQSVGSGSLIASTGGMGSWGEV